jgi:hypothetical protein
MSSATVAADSTLSVIGYQSIGLGEERRLVALWPFDGTLAELAGRGGVVVGEIYPRVAYAVAVAEGAPGERGLEPLSRNIRDVRREALERLRRSTWVKTHGVRLNVADLAVALESADAFDALMAAAALLRCVLEGEPLSAGEHGVAEGGILGSGAVVLGSRAAPSRTCRGRARS